MNRKTGRGRNRRPKVTQRIERSAWLVSAGVFSKLALNITLTIPFSEAGSGRASSVIVAAAQVRRSAHAGGASGHAAGESVAAVGVGRERGILLLQMAALATGGAQHLVDAGTAHQLLKLASAVLAQVFKDGHKSLHT